jgi:hypothetical protein
MKSSQIHYQSYLLRLWHTEDPAIWRIMLEEISTHQRYGFADLESCFAFIKAQTHGGKGQEARSKKQEVRSKE